MSKRTSTKSGYLILLILFAFALRVYRLDAHSLWYDEGVTANIARRSLPELTAWTANDIQPPLYYYVVAGWGRLAGWSEWSLRFPSLFFGTLLVPLLAALIFRLGTSPMAAVLAALFTALHPLLLYYSQEARMYTMLTVLGVLAGYCGLRIAACRLLIVDRVESRRYALYYGLAATAAAYTHYFAFLLLLALGIAFVLDHVRTRHYAIRNTLPIFLLANVIILLLYLPWFNVMFTRLAVDASYWQGEFKRWEALRNTALSFTSGATVHESQAIWLLLPFSMITLVAIINLIRRSRSTIGDPQSAIRNLQSAIPWLVIPVAGVLLLASFAPKFNTRYVLIALPGLILLWSGGLADMLEIGAWRVGIAEKRRRPISNLQSLLPIVAIAFISLTSLYATASWFFDRAFAKDEWRALAAFLRTQLEPQETIILVSGHAWPVWDYYAPDLPVVRLPAIDVLDVNAVLDFANTAAPLRAAFAETSGITGAWLIEWQDEVVDPTGIVPTQLELGGREKGVSARFWGLNLRRFSQIRPQRIVAAPPITQVVDANFGHQLVLRGYHVLENGDLLLFWQRSPDADNPHVDYQIAGQTLTSTGEILLRLADQRPAAYDYPVARWPPGAIVMGHLPATQWLAAQPTPGTYTFQLSVYTVAGDQMETLTTDDGRTLIELPITITEFD